ncbi:MAG: semialdehyde dehydrogenase, partial [Fimbriimonadaceae bacterium]|nr:semialdehyde dehydrogenase [Fimbriimonadaceae bacterium]
MAKTVALMGAGGKMGMRIARNLLESDRYMPLFVEPSDSGRANLATLGKKATEEDEALKRADSVILALPDTLLGPVSQQVVPRVKPGCQMITLDPAAAHAGVLATRPDITLFVTHPCHPPLWNDEEGDA